MILAEQMIKTMWILVMVGMAVYQVSFVHAIEGTATIYNNRRVVVVVVVVVFFFFFFLRGKPSCCS